MLLIHQQCSESTATEIDPNTSTTTGVTAEDTDSQETNLPNILFILADDLGVDAMPGYDLGAKKPSMPTIERLANQGVRFTKAWSNPVCSPTREHPNWKIWASNSGLGCGTKQRYQSQ